MTRALALLAPCALLLAACNDTQPVRVPDLDRFYYPTGLAVRHVDTATGRGGCALSTVGTAACQTQLFVVSSNFDLRFDLATGGTVVGVDVAKALSAANPAQAPAPLTAANGLLGDPVRIGSFGGELAIVDEETCPGWESELGQKAQVLVASRSQIVLYRLDIADDGSLSCGADCLFGLNDTLGDPYGLTVACPRVPSTGKPRPLALVTYLRAAFNEGWLSRVDLFAGERTEIDLGIAPTRSSVYDPASTRLWVTENFAVVGIDPLRWLTLGGDAPSSVPGTLDVYSLVRGAEMRAAALSQEADAVTPASRAYLALRIYDADTAVSTGLRPIQDLAGGLGILDISETSAGVPRNQLLDVIPLDRGVSEVRVVPRDLEPTSGRPRKSLPDESGAPDARVMRSLVATTNPDDGTVSLYDDELGQIAKVFSACQAGADADATIPKPCPLGQPLLGRQPFGLAAEPLPSGHVRLYVGSFDQSWVNVVEIDPLHPSAAPVSWARIGPERSK